MTDRQRPVGPGAAARSGAGGVAGALPCPVQERANWCWTNGLPCKPAPERMADLRPCACLLQHPTSTLQEPQPRSQPDLGAVPDANPAAFHRADAAGYVFWAERVLEIDGINPNWLPAWRARWIAGSRLAEPYRSAALRAIARVSRQNRPVQRRARSRGPRSARLTPPESSLNMPNASAPATSSNSSAWMDIPSQLRLLMEVVARACKRISHQREQGAPWAACWAPLAAKTCKAKSRRSWTSSPTKC